jgi:hypothetical protein
MITQTQLAPVYDNYALDENLEPNFVRIRAPNQNFLYINSEQQKDTEDPSYLVTKLDLPLNRVSRITTAYFNFYNVTPNINQRNNNVTILTNTGFKTFTVPEGNYTTIVDRWTAIMAQLAIADPGLTYNVISSPLYANTAQVTLLAGANMRVVSGSMVECGRYLLGLNTTNTGAGITQAVWNFSAITDNYTRWIDVLSNEITTYSKLRPGGYRIQPGHLFRLFINDISSRFNNYIYFTNETPALEWINFNSSRSIENIDIRLIDEFGKNYYIPLQHWPTFNISILFLCQL